MSNFYDRENKIIRLIETEIKTQEALIADYTQQLNESKNKGIPRMIDLSNHIMLCAGKINGLQEVLALYNATEYVNTEDE